jgi:hypothetical protein
MGQLNSRPGVGSSLLVLAPAGLVILFEALGAQGQHKLSEVR